MSRRVDRVRVNGRDIGPGGAQAYLHGVSETWIKNEFRVPIELIHFGKLDANGGNPIPGVNEIRIDVDVGNPSGDPWCTAIDWAEIGFDAMAPVIMIHGNHSRGTFFEEQFSNLVQPFKDAKVPFDNSITMVTDTIAAHAKTLQTLIPQKAGRFGAKHAHLVAHSKGGLDSRAFLGSTIPSDFGVLSLITLSTPHHGSAGAAYIVASEGANPWLSQNGARVQIAQYFTPDDATRELTPESVIAFNAQNNLPNELPLISKSRLPVAYRSISADADLNGNGLIDYSETIGIPGQGNYSPFCRLRVSLPAKSLTAAG